MKGGIMAQVVLKVNAVTASEETTPLYSVSEFPTLNANAIEGRLITEIETVVSKLFDLYVEAIEAHIDSAYKDRAMVKIERLKQKCIKDIGQNVKDYAAEISNLDVKL